jgi:hypothetical protein
VNNQPATSSIGELFQKMSTNVKWCVLVKDVTRKHALEIAIFSIMKCLASFPVKNAKSSVVVKVWMVDRSVHLNSLVPVLLDSVCILIFKFSLNLN